MSETGLHLQRLLQSRFPAAAHDFLAAADFPAAHDAAELDQDRFLAAFSSATRRFGKKPLALSEGERDALRAAGIPWSLDAWTTDELGRIVALVRIAAHLCHLGPDAMQALLEACYARGDNRERAAVLRALPFLPDPARLVALAVESCRSSVDTIFGAICCDNPFPARHFPEANFCQMVIKALFTGTPVARIVGLRERITSELVRMASDFASERRAAGRAIPDDLQLLLESTPPKPPTPTTPERGES